MDFVVTKTIIQTQQLAIVAETPQEALDNAKKGDGTPIAINENTQYGVQPRPAAPPNALAMRQAAGAVVPKPAQ